MADALIVAIISLVATIITVVTGAYIRWYSDKHSEVAEDEKLIARYRDPILRAAQELQSRLYNIAQTELLSWIYAEANADANAAANAAATANVDANANSAAAANVDANSAAAANVDANANAAANADANAKAYGRISYT
ncbi:hypothetical protein BG000_003076 [Podila horticola]|nr:hypothetical protein BG000_003076 [Podila horticola]